LAKYVNTCFILRQLKKTLFSFACFILRQLKKIEFSFTCFILRQLLKKIEFSFTCFILRHVLVGVVVVMMLWIVVMRRSGRSLLRQRKTSSLRLPTGEIKRNRTTLTK
jgi:hypothetical protein